MAGQTTSADANAIERRKTFAETGHRTLNALLIVSGGAAVTFLTFLGSALGGLKELPVAKGAAVGVGESIPNFIAAMYMYVASVAFCITAQGITYLAQAAYHFYKDELGFKLMVSSAILSLISIFTFVIGSILAIWAVEAAASAIVG